MNAFQSPSTNSPVFDTVLALLRSSIWGESAADCPLYQIRCPEHEALAENHAGSASTLSAASFDIDLLVDPKDFDRACQILAVDAELGGELSA